MSAYEENIRGFVQANAEGIKAAIKGAREGIAIAVMPDGSLKPLGADENWLGEPSLPQYIVFKNEEDRYGIILTEAHLGEGLTGKVYKGVILYESFENRPIQPGVIKAVYATGEDALAHEIQFSTEDVRPAKKMVRVGKIQTAFFDYIAGEKLVSEITEEGIDVSEALLNLDFEDRCQLMIDLCSKIEKMHTREEGSFCHLDLNFDNLLVEMREQRYYKACHIIDHGQSQLLDGKELTEPAGKMFWNSKEANELAGKGQQYAFVPGTKTDIVPLGAMGYVIFAARTNASPADYNLFLEKQKAYRGIDFKGIFGIRAVANAPFVINANFINPGEWTLQTATAERMNELMKVFFERMVSDDLEERPSAAQARQFFCNIKELYHLNHISGEEAQLVAALNPQNQERLLAGCEVLAFPLPIDGAFSEAISPVIWQLKHILSSPEYLNSQKDDFCREKIKFLIECKKKSNPIIFENEAMKWNSLLDAVSRMDDMIADDPSDDKKRSKIDFIVVFMEAYSLNKEILNFLKKEKSFYEKYPNAKDNLKIDVERLRIELEKMAHKDGYEETDEFQKKSSEFYEKFLFLREREHLILKEKNLKQKISLVKASVRDNFGMKMEDMNSSGDEIARLKSEMESESEVSHEESEELGKKERVLLIQNKMFILNVKICMTEIFYSEKICQGFVEQDHYEDAIRRYKDYLDAYKECLRSSEESNGENGNQISVVLEPVNEENDPVLSANKKFLDAVRAKNNENHPENEKALTTILNYQANELRNLVVAMDPNKENELAPPVPCKDEQYVGAMQKLEAHGKTDLVALGLMSLGIILGVTMVVTAAIAITALVGITCPPALLALPVVGPMLSAAYAAPMLVAATAAISTLGYVASVAFGIKKQKDSEKAMPKEMANADQLVREKYKNKSSGTVANNPYLFRAAPTKKNKENAEHSNSLKFSTI